MYTVISFHVSYTRLLRYSKELEKGSEAVEERKKEQWQEVKQSIALFITVWV